MLFTSSSISQSEKDGTGDFKNIPNCLIMKVKIKQWDAVASWRWDMPEDEVCGICRVQFDFTCPTCKYPGDDCTLCMTSFKRNPTLIHATWY